MEHVVIVGGGFGGLTAARALKGAPVRITLVDKRNHHLFQPLLYQVATAGLSPADIAAPIRSVVHRQKNVEVLLGEVVGVDRLGKKVRVNDEDGKSHELAYDRLILATGSHHSYFGRDEWEKHAPGLKTLADATRIRQKILLGFEKAEMETDPVRRKAWTTFILVGGGPTGVELAGSIAELAHQALKSDFRRISPGAARIVLIEAGPRILAGFPEKLSKAATRYLEKRGVEILCSQRVENVHAEGVLVGGVSIESKTVVWAAGVLASPAGKWLGAETDRAGRVKVGADLSVPGSPEIYVIGDTALVEQSGRALPGVAPVAMQQGRYVADRIRQIARAAKSGTSIPMAKPFKYFDKGNLATVGRSFAIVDLAGLQLAGFSAWVIWIVVHIYYLIGFRNRLVVMLQWAWAYLTFQRGARLISE